MDHLNDDSDIKEKEQHDHKGHKSHALLMILCCAIPLVLLLLVLPAVSIYSPLLKSVLPFAVFLLCPLMHIFMMRGMHKSGKKEHDHEMKQIKQMDLDRKDER